LTPFPILVAVLGWLCLGLETGLRPHLSMNLGMQTAAPSYVIPLAVFIALCATPSQALWTCLCLGLCLDLLSPRQTAGAPLTIVGPYAIGLLVAGQFVLAMRGIVIRRNPLTVLALSIPAALIVGIVVVALLTLRNAILGGMEWSPTGQLGARFVSALLTGVSGLIIGILLMPLAPALGLHSGPMRRR
jgi:hypothetical protein